MIRVLEMFGEPITYGGQESVVYNMLSSFEYKNNFNIDLYTPYYADNNELIDFVKRNNGKVFNSDVDFRTNDNRFKLKDTVFNFFKSHHDYDIVHVHTGSLTTMVVYASAAKKFGIKRVIVHSHITNPNQGLLYKLRRFLLNLLLKPNVDYYLGCSKDALKSKFIFNNKNNSAVVYNGIDIEKFKFKQNYRDEIRNKYSITDKFVIGSLGRISKQKNCKFLIDILKKVTIPNFVLLIVGDGEELNSIKKYVSDNNLNDKVIFAGNQAETYKYYCAFDCFLMPSLYEGFPVTAIEAQVSGLPCAFSDKITNEVNISDTTKFLSLSIDKWVEFINININPKRNSLVDFNKFNKQNTFNIVFDIYKLKL